MSEATAPAQPDTSGKVQTHPRPRKGSGKVDHLFWTDAGEFAQSLGIEVRSVCGVWLSSPESFTVATYIRTTNGRQAVEQVGDCRRCLQIIQARARRGK